MDALSGLPPPDYELGRELYILWLSVNRWVKRRVETIEIMGPKDVRRDVSVDFALTLDDTPEDPRSTLAFLALLQKEPMVAFDLANEGGEALPLLTRLENGFAGWSMLAAAAAHEFRVSELQMEDHRELLADLAGIVFARKEEAQAAVERFEQRSRERAEPLSQSGLFLAAARSLAQNFLLLVPLQDQTLERRVLKFGYSEELRRTGSRWDLFVETMAWRPARFSFAAPAVGEAQSYHFEIRSPVDLRIARSQLWLNDPVEGLDSVDARVIGPRAHLYSPAVNADVDGSAVVWLRPVRPGLLRSGTIIAFAVFAVLLYFRWTGRLAVPHTGTQAAILLALPALIATLIVRPGEHGLVTELLVGVRSTVALSGGLAYAAALLLVTGVSGDGLEAVWLVLILISGFCCASLVIGMVGLRPRPLHTEDAAGLFEKG